MKKAKKILAPTDLSELSKAGIRYAVEMAASQGSEVIIYHMIGHEEAAPYFYRTTDDDSSSFVDYRPLSEIVEERKRLLAKFIRENFAGIAQNVSIRPEVEVGQPYKGIVDKADEEKADIIVMSTHGRTGLLHVLIGSVTEKVVRLAGCPVLSLRPTKLTQAAAA